MIKIENFDIIEPSGISYGGHGGLERHYNKWRKMVFKIS